MSRKGLGQITDRQTANSRKSSKRVTLPKGVAAFQVGQDLCVDFSDLSSILALMEMVVRGARAAVASQAAGRKPDLTIRIERKDNPTRMVLSANVP